MGAITFADAQTELKLILGNRTGIDSRIAQWLNWGHVRLAYNKSISHHEINVKASPDLVTVASVRTVALPADTHSILSIRDLTNKKKLQWRHWREFDWRDALVVGKPSQYTRYGGFLELDPTPDGVFTVQLRYRKVVPVLSGATPSSLNSIWDEAWIEVSAGIGYEKLLEPDRAAYHFGLVDALIESLMVPEFEEQDDASYTGMTAAPRMEN